MPPQESKKGIFKKDMNLQFFRQERIPFQQTLIIKEFIKNSKPGNILEIGCSTGEKTLKQLSHLGWNCLGIDINEKALKEAAKYAKVYLRRGNEPFAFIKNNSIDLVCAFDVFHHISDVEVTFHESLRCLKSSGIFLMIEHVEDSIFLRMGRNIFKKWEGMPILSRMYMKDWMNLFSKTPSVELLSVYTGSQYMELFGYLFYLFCKLTGVGNDLRAKYKNSLELKKHDFQHQDYSGAYAALFVLKKI